MIKETTKKTNLNKREGVLGEINMTHFFQISLNLVLEPHGGGDSFHN